MTDRKPSDDDDDTRKDEPAAADEASVDEAEADEGEGAGEENSEREAAAAATEQRRRKKRQGTKAGNDERRVKPGAGSSVSGAQVGLFVVLALAAGGAAGWFGHIAQAKAKLRADSAPAAAGSAAARGPCGAWEQKLCASGGEESALCQQAKAASEILPTSACDVALEGVPATLAKVKAERVPCDQLVSKLCADLSAESPACKLVKEKTPAFPAGRCKEMLGNYDSVLAELKQLEQQLSGQGDPMHPGMAHMPPPGTPNPHP